MELKSADEQIKSGELLYEQTLIDENALSNKKQSYEVAHFYIFL